MPRNAAPSSKSETKKRAKVHLDGGDEHDSEEMLQASVNENNKIVNDDKQQDAGKQAAGSFTQSIQFGEEDMIRVATNLYSVLQQLNADDEDEKVLSGCFIDLIEDTGLKKDDPRLVEIFHRLDDLGGLRKDIELSVEDFIEIIKGNSVLISKAMKGQLIIPDFPDFCRDIEMLYEKVKLVESGECASYIPALAQQDPALWAVAVCTIDGQEYAIGDQDYKFCIQSCCKPISYLIAAQENGFDFVHHHIGREPSGESFNKLHLKDFPNHDNTNRKVPHNPMINAGAIMSCALIARGHTMAHRFSLVMDHWTKLSSTPVSFSNTVYLSEKDTADRNWCLGYMMQEYDSFPPNTDLRQTLEFYFQQCSIEANIRQMSIMAATLANGGTNPKTGVRIFDPFHVRNCLSLMLSSGMYDYSGEWGFNIGLPAKSGVAGCVWLVVPNKVGIATFSPKLDDCGNSARGVAFCQELIHHFNFHQFDNLRGVISSTHRKKDPTLKVNEASEIEVTQILFASAHGDLNELMRLQAQGADLFGADYDYRSGLHLAASEGHLHVVKLFVMYARRKFAYEERADALSPRDRWGRTPLDDAISGQHEGVADFLRRQQAQQGAGAKMGGMTFVGKTDQKLPYLARRSSQENLLNEDLELLEQNEI